MKPKRKSAAAGRRSRAPRPTRKRSARPANCPSVARSLVERTERFQGRQLSWSLARKIGAPRVSGERSAITISWPDGAPREAARRFHKRSRVLFDAASFLQRLLFEV